MKEEKPFIFIESKYSQDETEYIENPMLLGTALVIPAKPISYALVDNSANSMIIKYYLN